MKLKPDTRIFYSISSATVLFSVLIFVPTFAYAQVQGEAVYDQRGAFSHYDVTKEAVAGMREQVIMRLDKAIQDQPDSSFAGNANQSRAIYNENLVKVADLMNDDASYAAIHVLQDMRENMSGCSYSLTHTAQDVLIPQLDGIVNSTRIAGESAQPVKMLQLSNFPAKEKLWLWVAFIAVALIGGFLAIVLGKKRRDNAPLRDIIKKKNQNNQNVQRETKQ